MYKRLEIHNHTTESDSSLSCKELLEFMICDKVDAFALTDHNTISGHKKMQDILNKTNHSISCIYGMEYTTYYGHILCLNLKEYVPWEDIDINKPEKLFAAAKEKGALVGIAHPFSYGYPFANGCRFEMKINDYSSFDFIEIFNDLEPLHEVNEPALLWWEDLNLKGCKLAMTCGMDLHGKWNMSNQFATFIEGEENGDVEKELNDAILYGNTYVSKGQILSVEVTKENILKLSIIHTGKPGTPEGDHYIVSLRTEKNIQFVDMSENETLSFPLSKLEDATAIIPKLYINDQTLENLVCISPVIFLS